MLLQPATRPGPLDGPLFITRRQYRYMGDQQKKDELQEPEEKPSFFTGLTTYFLCREQKDLERDGEQLI